MKGNTPKDEDDIISLGVFPIKKQIRLNNTDK